MARSPITRQDLATLRASPRRKLELLRREDGVPTLRELPHLTELEGTASPANSNAAWRTAALLFTRIASETQMHH